MAICCQIYSRAASTATSRPFNFFCPWGCMYVGSFGMFELTVRHERPPFVKGEGRALGGRAVS